VLEQSRGRQYAGYGGDEVVAVERKLQRKHRRKFSSPWLVDLKRIREMCICNTRYRHQRFCEEEDCFSESHFDLFLQ
jgi:hypothetical protein